MQEVDHGPEHSIAALPNGGDVKTIVPIDPGIPSSLGSLHAHRSAFNHLAITPCFGFNHVSLYIPPQPMVQSPTQTFYFFQCD